MEAKKVGNCSFKLCVQLLIHIDIHVLKSYWQNNGTRYLRRISSISGGFSLFLTVLLSGPYEIEKSKH